MDNVSRAWQEAYAASPRGIQAGWRNILGHMSFPREVLIQLPGPEEKRYNEAVHTYQQYAKVLLENAPRRDCWVGWSRPQDHDLHEMTWIFGDVDSNVHRDADPHAALKESLAKARRFQEFSETTFGVNPAAIFSCGKGFHCLVTHDPVPYRGQPYSDAILRLSDKFRVYLDAGPLKHRKAKPRVPYSINLKATGREKAPMFVVPVDLSWDLPEIIQAAKECRVTPFKVPHSTEAAQVILPIAKAIHERRRKAIQKRLASGDTGVDMDRIRSTVVFCEEQGPYMVDGRGRPDGRRRMLSVVLIPALAHLHKGDQETILADAKAWVESCKGSWVDYGPLANDTLKHLVTEDGDLRQPMAIPRWLAENPGLRFPR